MAKSMDLDLPLKLRFRRLLFIQGYWSPIEVELSQYENDGRSMKRQSLTDLDVLGIKYDKMFARHCVVGDCKTGRNVSDANRLFWLRGVSDYFAADAAYYLRPRVDAHVAAIAPKMGLRTMTEGELTEAEKRLGADKCVIPLADIEIHRQVEAKWGIALASKSKPTPEQLKRKKVYSHLSYAYWYFERFRSLMQLVGTFQNIADILEESNPGDVLLAYVGLERFAHCLLEAACQIHGYGTADIPKNARLYFFGGPHALREKERLFELMQKLGLQNEPLDPPWFGNTVEVLSRLISHPTGGADVLRHLSCIYLWCVHLGNTILPPLSPEGANTEAVVLARDIADEFVRATGVRKSLFDAMRSL